MVCLYSGLFIPPRRALVAEFKIKNINKTDDNYIEKISYFSTNSKLQNSINPSKKK
jgi:hypothetical protein